MKTHTNKHGFTVVSDGRSKPSSAGRPPKKSMAALRHIEKLYASKQFTSKEFLNSYRLQLQSGETPPNVQAGMLLRNLCKSGKLEVVGLKDNGKRGNNNKVYKLAK